MNKFEAMKQVKDGLDVLEDIPRFARDGFESIPEEDLERLKWAGIFHRKPTRPYFMMRIRFPAGIASAHQLQTVADIISEHGRSIGDFTTRQQIEPRWLRIEDMPVILDRLGAAGLTSLQTGMDNVRGVISCPMAGISPREVLDAAPLCRQFQELFVGDRAFTNLPRKFNVAITGCPENCIGAESQDVALVPAVNESSGGPMLGFNVLVGGKMGSGGFHPAEPLDVFVPPEDAARICRELVLIFRDFGPREARSRARFAFLIEERGLPWVRALAEERMGHPLAHAGRDLRSTEQADHLGITPQRQSGLSAVGLLVPVGRFTACQLRELARLATGYGSGQVRLTTDQNVIIPDVPEDRLPSLLAEPLLQEWTPFPSPALRGLVACTGTEFCNLALIETKARAMALARALEGRIPDRPIRIRWSGCPAGCGNHHTADIGLQGKRVRLKDGRVVEAVTVSFGGRGGPAARAATVVHEDVPCDGQLLEVIERLLVAEAVGV